MIFMFDFRIVPTLWQGQTRAWLYGC